MVWSCGGYSRDGTINAAGAVLELFATSPRQVPSWSKRESEGGGGRESERE
ncbi:hypothetical protein C2845_PM05G02280 [Panicum miliaceum]|uniref:Uncharacterized protein n=1 Tax=Panicum miliaceum TaxID=4540 RepID=A0A3L6SV93_PANMI|nr:hypothetical protein C2845_PM05G02280 [Panicum miliaceum]